MTVGLCMILASLITAVCMSPLVLSAMYPRSPILCRNSLASCVGSGFSVAASSKGPLYGSGYCHGLHFCMPVLLNIVSIVAVCDM